MKNKGKFLPVLAVLALLTMLFVVSPVSGAATGAVTFDKAYVTTPGGVLTVTLTDADLNIGVVQSNEANNFGGTPYTITVGAPNTFFHRVQKFPILDQNGDGSVNFQDITVSTTTITVLSVDTSGGLITFQSGAGAVVGTTFTVTYTAADVQTATVKIYSTTDPTGFIMTLLETGANTGSFTASVKTGLATTSTNAGNPTTTTRPVIGAVTGAIVSAAYTDASPSGTRVGNATVETTAPTVVVTTPASGTATRTQATRLIAEVTDADSGAVAGTIAFNIVGAVDALGAPVGGIGTSGIVTTAISGGFRAETTLTGVPAGETTITWNVSAGDTAGNTGFSDSDSATAGSQNHILKIDTVAPVFATPMGAISGQSWDAANSVIITAAASAKNNMVRVIFNEALDGTTVQRTDFTVGGVTPLQADWFSGAASSVFLTVSPMASDAKPVVALTNSISDVAGNANAGGTNTTAFDGIAPTIAVVVTPTLSTGTATIDITSDEALLTAPTITANGAGTGLTSPILTGTNKFRSTFTAPSKPMVYNIQVTVSDTTGNAKSAGTALPTATGAILYEADNVIPTPGVDPVNASTVYRNNPFITIGWTAEGIEYGLDAGGALTTTAANIATDLDTHNTVTITALTLDTVDKLASVSTTDNRTFILAASGLALGAHTLVFTGKDEAGNTLTVTTTFTVAVRPAFSVPLVPGWNLISLPGEPQNPAINAVIGANVPADVVLTYDPTVAGGWLTATRGADGILGGTLTTITANRAYWVHTSSFQPISVNLATLSGGTAAVPPTINLVKGWNLVPVIDVSATKVAGNVLNTAGTYLAGLSFSKVYEYDTINDRFNPVATGGNLIVGKGYWAYLTAAGVLVP